MPGVTRGSAESDLCTHAVLPDQGPRWLAPDDTLKKPVGSARHTSAPATQQEHSQGSLVRAGQEEEIKRNDDQMWSKK